MEIETSRLYIRDLYETDWGEMKEIFIDFNRSKYAAFDRPLPKDDDESKSLTKQFSDTGLFFAVHLLENSKMIGYVCFHKNGDSFDLGYCFHSAYHSNGYAYESVTALIEYFAKKHHVISFTAATAIENTPSCRLLERLGFVHVSTETVSFDGKFSFQSGNFTLKIT